MSDGGGGYLVWTSGDGLENVCKWAKAGLSDQQIADNIGISVNTYRSWRRRFPEFASAIDKARIEPNLELEASMLDLATGKAYVEEIKTILDPNTGKVTKIEKTRRQIPPNPAMQMFLARSRMPERYSGGKVDDDGLGDLNF